MFFNLAKNEKYFNKLIYLGSGAEYGKDKPLVKIKESDFGKNIPKDEYGLYKYLCSKYVESSNKYINLRLFGVYGKHEDYRFRFISNAICRNIYNMPITINQNVFFDYVYINDFLNILEYFIKHRPKHSSYNIGKGVQVDLVTLANIINKVADKKSDIIISKRGLNNEYTCNNNRLKSEMANLMFTNDNIAIKELYSWYRRNTKNINKRNL